MFKKNLNSLANIANQDLSNINLKYINDRNDYWSFPSNSHSSDRSVLL